MLAAIIAIVIVGIIAAATAVERVSAFYDQRFGFSLWSCVLLLVVAVSLLLITETVPFETQTRCIFMVILEIL